MPKAARAAVWLALLIAFVLALSARMGPIMLLGFSFAALLSAVRMLQRRAWGAYGFAFLLILSMLTILFLAVTGQSAGGFLQVTIGTIIYAGLAGLFLLAGHSLSLTGAKRGTPIPWILLALVLSVPVIVYRPVTVTTGSMEDTLLIGDSLLVERSSNAHPAFGDLVAFHYPLDRSQVFVKRVIGLPGDRIHFTHGKLYRNGAPVDEPYITHKLKQKDDAASNFPTGVDMVALQSTGRQMIQHNLVNGEVVVPPNKYFVAGDSRDNAFDSRNWGFLDSADIIGKPKFIYDSLAPDPADVGQPQPTHASTRRWERVFKAL
jgi:signal peptidase I